MAFNQSSHEWVVELSIIENILQIGKCTWARVFAPSSRRQGDGDGALSPTQVGDEKACVQRGPVLAPAVFVDGAWIGLN